MPRAVEEVLRFEPITPFTARIVVEELTFRDVTFPVGTIVMVCAFTGNRDLAGEISAAEAAGASTTPRVASRPGVTPASELAPGGADGGVEGARGGAAEEVRADVFDITATDRGSARARSRALTFGAGVHYCLGANLARLELEEALAFLAPRMPGLELAGEPVYEGITGIYGLAELPLRFAV